MEKKESKLDKRKLEELLENSGLEKSDLEKLKDRRFEDISEEAKKVLRALGITKEVIEQASLVESRALVASKKREGVEKSEDLEKSEASKELRDEETRKDSNVTLAPREEIENFLRDRSLSQCLIRTLLKVGFTDEFVRLLKAMGFTEEDIAVLQNLWGLEKRNLEKSDSFVSLPSSSDEYLSPDGLYLKNLLSKPLTTAIREIIAKKPFDPVEYLGHWLLHYKICEERDRRRREFELELIVEREKLVPHEVEENIPTSIEREEEETYLEDWDYLDDE